MPKAKKRIDLISISGKDSLCTALVQRKRAPHLDYHYLFCDVGMELPETYAWLDKVEKKFDLHIHRIGKSLEGLMGEYRSLPSFTSRFCTRAGKIEPIMEYIRDLDADEVVQYIGFRFDEKDRLPPPQSRAEMGKTVYPLIEEEIDIAGVYRILEEQEVMPPLFFWKRLYDEVWKAASDASKKFIEAAPAWVMSGLFSWRSRSNCFMCLAGETEVVTSQGIKKIKDLAGTFPELLVPKAPNGIISEVGSFVKAPIRSFGIQKLFKITLARAKTTKEVFATEEHRWLLAKRKPHHPQPQDKITSELKPGDKLRNLFRCPVGEGRGQVLKLGAMRGFTFGDGVKALGGRPGTVHVFDGKDAPFLPMFSAVCTSTYYPPRGEKGGELTSSVGYNSFYGLPRDWKDYPPLDESRSFLLGWLSGWFAADGCVSENGQCILSAANPEHLEFGRSVCAILGIQCSPVRTQHRKGVKGIWSNLSHITIYLDHLTDDFFWLAHHKERASQFRTREKRRMGWKVVSVEHTDRVEEVFCATVEDVGAFGLADGLMTGNCFYQALYEWVGLLEYHPDLFDKAEEIERIYGDKNSEFQLALSQRPKLTTFTLNPTMSLAEIRRRKDSIFDKRVEATRKLVVEARHTTGSLDMLSFRSCGAMCGK